MRQQQFVSKRVSVNSGNGMFGRKNFDAVKKVGTSVNWGQNHNIVRHAQNGLGKFAYTAILFMLVVICGLIYLTQGTKTSNYDYELSAIDREIAELSVKKDELKVEQARLTSVAKTEKTEVAKHMKEASVAGYVAE